MVLHRINRNREEKPSRKNFLQWLRSSLSMAVPKLPDRTQLHSVQLFNESYLRKKARSTHKILPWNKTKSHDGNRIPFYGDWCNFNNIIADECNSPKIRIARVVSSNQRSQSKNWGNVHMPVDFKLSEILILRVLRNSWRMRDKLPKVGSVKLNDFLK